MREFVPECGLRVPAVATQVTVWGLTYLGHMNQAIRVLLMSAMALPAVLTAQTLQTPDLHPQGYTFTYGVSNQQPSGWDWTNAFSLQDVALEFLPADSTAYADGFSNADYAQVVNAQGTQYGYYSYDADGMGFWGGVDANGVQVIHPEEILTMPFPFTVGDVHHDSLSFVFEAGGDVVHRDIDLISLAAEWGALLLPGELAFNDVMRVETEQLIYDSTATVEGGLLLVTTAFWAQDMPLPVAQSYTYSEVVGGDTSVLFVGSEFLLETTMSLEAEPLAQNLRTFPNPANDRVQIEGEPGQPWEVRSASGQMITQGQFGDLNQDLDVSRWEAGVYFAISGDQTSRLVVVH